MSDYLWYEEFLCKRHRRDKERMLDIKTAAFELQLKEETLRKSCIQVRLEV